MHFCRGPAGHVLTVRPTSHVFTTQLVSHVLVLQATYPVLAMQIVIACIGFIISDGLSEAPSSPQGPLAERLSDGLIMITGPCEHVRRHSGGRWLTSVPEVHWGHVSVYGPWVPCISATSCRPCLSRVNGISRRLAMWSISLCCTIEHRSS